MPKIMSDNDVLGLFGRLVSICQSPNWIGVWHALKIEVATFAEVNLQEDASDLVIWTTCRENDIVLVTGNRSAKGPESLQETILTHGDAGSLPVITLADSDRILRESTYAEQAAERLLEFLMDLENLRGAGRLYIP